MADQFRNPQGKKLLEEIGRIFKTKTIFQKPLPHVLFVCGGPLNKPSVRKSFIDWAPSGLPDFKVVIAEDAFREAIAHNPPKFVDLALFEKLIADISDGILIFPESVGSYAEVGYFSAIAGVRDKLLVVNDQRYQGVDSFVTLGPINTIDSHSFLKPTLHLTVSAAASDFGVLEQRLANRVHGRPMRRRLIKEKHYRKLNYREQLCVVSETIRIFGALTKEGLLMALGYGFGKADKFELEMLLSILVGAGWMSLCDEFFVPAKSFDSLVEIEGVDVDRLKVRALYYHQNNDSRAHSAASGNAP